MKIQIDKRINLELIKILKKDLIKFQYQILSRG